MVASWNSYDCLITYIEGTIPELCWFAGYLRPECEKSFDKWFFMKCGRVYFLREPNRFITWKLHLFWIIIIYSLIADILWQYELLIIVSLILEQYV